MKTNSMALKIWYIFTLIVIIVVCSISLIGFTSFNALTQSNQKQDLLALHNMLINEELKIDLQMNSFKNLADSQHFILTEDNEIYQIAHFDRPLFPKKPLSSNEQISTEKQNIQNWLKSFANNELDKHLICEKYNGTKYIAYITSINKDYFISYMPLLKDYQVIYFICSIILIFIIASIILIKIISAYITKPLKKLENLAEEISQKNFNNTIDIKSKDEIGRLAQSMEKMQKELKKVDDEEKLFLQSISHDLKTPVAVILAHSDAILDGMCDDCMEETATIIKNEAINLNKKIKQLLYLNTLDKNFINEEIEEIEIQEIFDNIVSRFKYSTPNINWKIDIENYLIKANYDRFTIAIENIIDNAIRYAKNEIKIETKVKDNHLNIEIYNDGQPIKEDYLEKIFEHMFKEKSGNFGLGLAISQKIIKHYGGNIFATNKEKGVSFNIIL